MNFQHRVKALVQFGELLGSEAARKDNDLFLKAYQHNPWFTETNVKTAFNAWSSVLNEGELLKWAGKYSFSQQASAHIAIIMAGNIPLVGFHDLLCVLISGNKAIVKVSDDDRILMLWALEALKNGEYSLADQISISEQRLPKDFDAVIATGSNNTHRYFEYYFRDKPSLLRKNRNSIAILTGNETTEDYAKLGLDIFTYFGLGCRNVSKLYIPKGYDLGNFYQGIDHWFEIGNHHKYNNNYTYHKALFLMNLAPHLDNNFILLKEETSIASPLGVLFFEEYESLDSLNQLLAEKRDEIQCQVSKLALPNTIPLGQSQSPALWDYADGVDTLEFIIGLNQP